MSQGFYELLGVEAEDSTEVVRAAYQRRLAGLVRRLRAARRSSGDTSVLEAEERALREAMEVLADPARRRRYDADRAASERGLPLDAEGLWEQARAALMDPSSAAAIEVVRALTDLPLGPPLAPEAVRRVVPAPPAPPAPVTSGALPPVQEILAPKIELAPPRVAATPAVPAPAADQVADQVAAPRAPSATARVARAPEPTPALPEDPMEALADRYGTDGRFLRAVREAQGMSLEDLARATRISQRYLEAIEENGYDRLPAGTFVRGYVKAVAQHLDLEEREVVDGYMALFTHHRG